MRQGITTIVAASLLGVLLSLNGCSPLLRVEDKDLLTLTPVQIQALDAAGQSVLVCIQGTMAGMGGTGSANVIAVPKTATGTAKFSVDCHPEVNINLQGVVK